MSKEIRVGVVRVFTNEAGEYGNPVGIVTDVVQELSPEERQQIATELGFSETVFIDSVDDPAVSIYDTTHPVKFAGHALVGVAWFLSSARNTLLESVRCSGMNIATWQNGPVQWLRAAMSLTPNWNHEQLKSPAAVDAVTNEEAATKKHVYTWAWQDEAQSIVRARTFLPDWGILEDQGNGSGSMQRAVDLGREIKVIHGKGSVIYARPADDGYAELGGQIVLDVPRTVTLSAK